MTKFILPIFGDQLSHRLASLRQARRSRDIVLMVESDSAANRVRYHKKKLAFVISSMRHFANELLDAGWDVRYLQLGDPKNTQSITGEIYRACSDEGTERVCATEPGNWSLRRRLQRIKNVDILEDDRFLCTHAEFDKWVHDHKQLRMEYFYREMRRKTGFLMIDGQPAGGRWNYDADNRKRLPHEVKPPQPVTFAPDDITKQVLALVESRYPDNIGSIDNFSFATTHRQASIAVDEFITHVLPSFGDYQDAMTHRSTHLYHAGISHYLNTGLLDPVVVCQKVADAYETGNVPLNAAEGFIRQIIGWREFVRGIYWRNMPAYLKENFFGHDRMLPSFYWDAKTELACLASAIGDTRDNAYAHHIQRLMLTGNFALLIGVDPRKVHEWYLSVYIDAFDWVEVPNTLGMSQFADAGLIASKPYLSGGNYINRMSDYCGNCQYDVKKRYGPTACPFNYLYWNFLDQQRSRLANNARLANAYRTWDRMTDDRRSAVTRDAQAFLDKL